MNTIEARIRYRLKHPPSWRDCIHASCWDGANASRRLMNILSPTFPDAKVKEYTAWMLGRGCDTAHVILINRADGEGGGYNCATDANAARIAKRRIKSLFMDGFAIVPWLVTDDSPAWSADLAKNADTRIEALAKAGLFDLASYVVLGLEMDEHKSHPAGRDGWTRVANALRARYGGRIGVHHTSGNEFPFAGMGDIVLGQLDPAKASPANIRAQIAAIKSIGKSAVGFEYARHPDNGLARAALAAGAIGVGNW